MEQKRVLTKNFSYGGFVIFSDGSEYPAFFRFENSELIHVSIPKKRNDEDVYSHSDTIKYDLLLKRDRTRLKRKGIIGCKYETPTLTSLTFE